MTDELTKTFFDTFGIEPRDNFKGCENGITFYTYGCNMPSCKGCSKGIREKEYPQITDRILLELICIAMDITDFGASNVKDLKEIVLHILIDSCNKNEIEKLKNKIQNLFKES